MSKRTLPAAAIATRTGVQSVCALSALERFEPNVRAAAEDGPATIGILEQIGVDWWTGEGVTAKRISAALRAIGDRDVTVNVNSPGGDYFEGLAIYNLLREHKGAVTVNVLGMAASAASVIAMAGDTVRIARAGFLMIHNAWVVAQGDRNALREVADWLEPFDQVAIDIYQARSGLKAEDLRAMLDRETWIGGSDAVDKGFADELLAADQVKVDEGADPAARQALAAAQVDTVLARAGMPRSDRRRVLQTFKGGTPGAAAEGTLSAAFKQEAEALLASLTGR